MVNSVYILKNNSSDNLKKLGFKLKWQNEEGEELYTYQFPILKYNNITTLYCVLSVYTTEKRVKIDVYDGLERVYTRFYNNEYGKADPILTEIHRNIENKLKKLGIKERENKHVTKHDTNKPMRKMQIWKSQRNSKSTKDNLRIATK